MKKWKKIVNKFPILFLIIPIVSCNNEVREMKDKTFFEGQYNIFADEFFAKSEKEYFVYYYSLMCPPCQDLKEDMENFIKESDIKVYTLSLQNMNDDEIALFKERDESMSNEEMREAMLGCSELSDVYLVGTPTLYKINQNDSTHYLEDVILGYSKIINFIK